MFERDSEIHSEKREEEVEEMLEIHSNFAKKEKKIKVEYILFFIAPKSKRAAVVISVASNMYFQFRQS